MAPRPVVNGSELWEPGQAALRVEVSRFGSLDLVTFFRVKVATEAFIMKGGVVAARPVALVSVSGQQGPAGGRQNYAGPG